MTAAQAAAALGVRVQTLYAYVSRGLLRSESGPDRRQRRYVREDVERLRARREERRDPQKRVEEALYWGAPLLDSALTLIEGGRFYYRGRDALQWARAHTIEEVAALLWTGAVEQRLDFCRGGEVPARAREVGARLAGRPWVERFQVLLPLLASEDWRAYDCRPEAVVETGARLLGALLWTACDGRVRGRDMAHALQCAWAPRRRGARALLSAALVLCADHELNVSSFVARCTAAAGATPYEAVEAGLAALRGTRHGGASEQVAALWREADVPEKARQVVAARLRRGEPVPGFGHKLYPGGDPRWRLLFELAGETMPRSAAVAMGQALAEAGRELLGESPNLDMGLAVVTRALGLDSGAALALFALGRAVGWIGHALEQYRSGAFIRPRARYVGVRPPIL